MISLTPSRAHGASAERGGRGDARQALAELMAKDERCAALAFGLGQLTTAELLRLRRALVGTENVLLDGGNYDPASGSWCPLAIGLGIPDQPIEASLTPEEGSAMILAAGRSTRPSFTLNPISGTRGQFFRDDRRGDLYRLVEWILAARPDSHG